MTAAKLASDFNRLVLPAIFSASGCATHGDGPRVLVYPYKSGLGYLWLLMEGDIIREPMTKIIRCGGKEDQFRAAVDKATESLMDRIISRKNSLSNV